MSRLSDLNNRRSTDNPTRGITDEEGLHLTDITLAQTMSLLRDRMSRTRYINHYHLEPEQQIPRYVSLPTYAFPLYQAIHDEALDHYKDEGWEIIPIDVPKTRFLNDNHFKHKMIVGQFSITDTQAKTKYLLQIPYTVTDCAKAYIRICERLSEARLKPQYNKYTDRIDHIRKGIKYFSGYYTGELAYVDIKTAYWSILWPTTIDMRYDMNTQTIMGDGQIQYWYCDQFAMHRDTRHVLNTLFAYRKSRMWDPETRRLIQGPMIKDRMYRPYNTGYIHDVMNAVVVEATQKFNILQWLTDAAILPLNQAEAFMEFLFEEWFLASRIKYFGEGTSNRIDMYDIRGIDGRTTRNFKKRIIGTTHNELRPANIEELKKIRQQAKNGTLPDIKQRIKKKRVFGKNITVAIPAEITLKPKKKLIAPKRTSKGTLFRQGSINPKETQDISEFVKKWTERQENDNGEGDKIH